MGGVVYVNPGSGGDGSPSPEEIATALRPCGISVEPLDEAQDLADLVGQAVRAGRRPIGLAGGDGTVRTVAEVLAGTEVPMLVVPAGTRNHFAREVGIEDLEDAVNAAQGDHVKSVSVGRVNGHVFVNNASIGLYPALVRQRESLTPYRSKRLASLVAAVALVRHGEPIDVCIDGTDICAWLVFVGNGRYGDGFTDLIERDSLTSAVLDIRVIRADRRFARNRVVLAFLTGRLRKSPLLIAKEAAEVSVGVPGRRIDVALDGEVVAINGPLCLSVEVGAIQVLTSLNP